MSIKEIETAITQLPSNDVGKLFAWLEQYHHELWDQQIEQDLEAGRLDGILAEAEKQYQAGQAKPREHR